jgi:hypothetical protein
LRRLARSRPSTNATTNFWRTAQRKGSVKSLTTAELEGCLNLLATNYNRPLDDNIMTLWEALFCGFNYSVFKQACLEVVKTNKFFPAASEIIDAYENLRNKYRDEKFERSRAAQLAMVAEQAYCYLCDNKGFCWYTKTVHGLPYEYMSRCVCLHGEDLNQYSESQANERRVPPVRDFYSYNENNAIKSGVNPFYIKNIREALGDEYHVYEARRKERYMVHKGMTASDLQKEVNGMSPAWRAAAMSLVRDNNVFA